MKVPSVKLNDGNVIPQVGLGLWKIKDSTDFKIAFESAIENNYRHFDTAQMYGNEHMLGEALATAKIARKEVFITTKIWLNNFGRRQLRKSFDESLAKLQTDYVDLLLLHFPVTVLRRNAWQVLETIKADGDAKSIGVSNYTIKHLEDMKNYAKVLPAINQVELHVFLQQPELIKYCRDAGVVIEAYSPLARAQAMDDPVITKIAQKYNRTYAQIMLRWLVEQDLVVLPKSVTPSRIRENINIFDFQLDKEDLEAITNLERNWHTTWDPTRVP